MFSWNIFFSVFCLFLLKIKHIYQRNPLILIASNLQGGNLATRWSFLLSAGKNVQKRSLPARILQERDLWSPASSPKNTVLLVIYAPMCNRRCGWLVFCCVSVVVCLCVCLSFRSFCCLWGGGCCGVVSLFVWVFLEFLFVWVLFVFPQAWKLRLMVKLIINVFNWGQQIPVYFQHYGCSLNILS